ncbi:amidohydrolase family protein [Faunimonas sp. B44]|uniref:amidohydrolase family protein n=1 Tax=Faunimonas sp. B44 TaxID=3461493 RepID=UPI00404466D9
MGSFLFRNVHLMSCNAEIGDMEKADVLVDGSVVSKVGTSVDAAGAEVIDATGMLMMPGMIDTHTHLWESVFKGRVADGWGMEYFTNVHPLVSYFEPEDTYAGVYAGAVEALAAGVTSMFDYNHCIHSPEHADASVAALRDSGIRATLGYDLRGKSPNAKQKLAPSADRFPDIERLRGTIPNGSSDLLRLAVCLSDVNSESTEMVAREVAFSRDIGCPMSWHCNKAGEIEFFAGRGLLGPDMLPAHGNYTTDEDLRLLGSVGGCLTSQPEAETYAGRRSMSMVARGHRRGVTIATGIDVPCIMNAGLLPQMRLLFFLQRYLDGVVERHEGHVPVKRRPGVPTFDARDIVEIATVNGAKAIWIDDVVGQIAPGYQADLVLIDTRDFGLSEGDPAGHVVLNSSLGDVDTVMVAGEFKKRDGRMVGVDHRALVDAREAARDRVYARAGEAPGGLHKTYWSWSE